MDNRAERDEIEKLKRRIDELEKDIEWLIQFLRATTNPSENELIQGYFKLRKKRTSRQ